MFGTSNAARWILCTAIFWLMADSVALAATLPQERFGRRRPTLPGTVTGVQWSEDGKHVDFTSEGKRYRFHLDSRKKEELEGAEAEGGSDERGGLRRSRPSDGGTTGRYVGRPTRGRQYTKVVSPDEKWEASYENWNVQLKNLESEETFPVTTEGNDKIHFGTASWVYGEELNQVRAMWWTPDSKKLLFYKFDDTHVKPFHLVRGWSDIGTSLYTEYYPKAGDTNPTAELMVYDLASKKTIRVDIGGDPDEYIYKIRSSPGGSTMLLNWTDRLQQHLKVLAIDLETGKCRTIVEERQDTWQSNYPRMRYLKDQKRFLWPTDKTGFTHYEIRDLEGNLHNTVTRGDFQIESILSLDEESGWVAFSGYSSPANPYFLQFHMVKLDGSGQLRVTTRDLHHSNFQLSPDKKWLIAQYESVNTPPNTALYSTNGEFIADIAESDPSSASHLAEMFQFRSDDDQFDVYGILYKPRDFDPNKKYPVINSVYGGPGSREFTPTYVSTPRSECNKGYLVVKVNNRGTGRRGKAFLSAAYKRLGDVDIQDHADAIRLLRKRPYFDGSRVGIVGHSYGGYMAAMGVFKHPDVYAASVIRAAVTDWRNYDTIYTERYMSTPQLNPEGYKVGAAVTHVEKLKGKVYIMHGMIDDNVHPNNAFQLIEAMNKAGLSYESRLWPNGGHGLGKGASETQQEFFDRILCPERPSTD